MLRCGVIGLGNAGRKHLKVYEDHPECEVVQTANQEFDWDVPMDLVSICSPDQFHAAHIEQAETCGIDIFSEKPLVTNRTDLKNLKFGRELQERRGQQNVRLSMNMVMRARVPKTEGAYRIDAAYNWGRKEKLKGWRGYFDYHPILGGGIHLIDLMIRDKGIPQKVESFHQPLTSTTLLQWEGCLGTLVSDLNSPPPHFHQYDVWHEESFWRYPGGPDGERYSDSVVQTSFIDSILHGAEPMVTEEDVFNTMKVCFDAIN
jgi:predicted dehydrogenase